MTIGGLTWDTQGKHYYYTGIDGVALYVWDNNAGWYAKPVAWDGVTAANESPSGAESNKLYADNIEYLNLLSKEEFGLTLEAYQVPTEFDPCDGIATDTTGKVKVHGQNRALFGLVYRVLKGTDTIEAGGKVEGNTKGNGYVYHIVYGCKAAPASRDFATVNDSPEAMTLSYEISTTALTWNGLTTSSSNFPLDTNNKPVFNAVAHIEIDCSELAAAKQSTLEGILYSASAAMPTPYQINAAIN